MIFKVEVHAIQIRRVVAVLDVEAPDEEQADVRACARANDSDPKIHWFEDDDSPYIDRGTATAIVYAKKESS